MLWFLRRARLTPEQEREQERSQAQIEAGGLPIAAEERLRELAGGGPGFFSSDLTVNEFVLLEREGIRPIAQVMGSSIFKHGWTNLPYLAYGRSEPVTSISDAFNGARERALSRLGQEAALAGADAVVAVRINSAAHEWMESDTVEFTAVGTAVRLPPQLRTGAPVITDLSGQQYWQLAQAGYRPVGVVGISTVVYVASGSGQNRVLNSGNAWFSGAGRANQELPDFTRGFYDARELALEHLNDQAAALGAHGIVGVQFDEHIREREYEDSSRNRRNDLIIYIHLLGTAITEGHAPAVGRHELATVLPVRPQAP